MALWVAAFVSPSLVGIKLIAVLVVLMLIVAGVGLKIIEINTRASLAETEDKIDSGNEAVKNKTRGGGKRRKK